ncbi:anti-sigma factor [Paenibacillus xerothermodurans]|uniref:Regulator of SigK n=1 Tax=Paenibacillus xerothermodurans TaxID=1977292 RepID=A0A2W1NC07_PAEXE|nr:anti-sigma factor [Paenibacillus xerothermodurans]PZE21190.1 hypothetical protein CBW46_007395 [Paenibacillus xerothermodurans]
MSSRYSDKLCELVELYALDGLEVHQKVTFEHHLTECALCRNQLIQLQHVVDLLPLAAEPTYIPASMRERVLRGARNEAAAAAAERAGGAAWQPQGQAVQLISGECPNRSALPAALTSEEQETPELSRRATYAERNERKAGRWRWISVGLAAAVFGLCLWSYQLQRNGTLLTANLAEANNMLQESETKLAGVQAELTAAKQPAEALKATQTVILTPTIAALGCKANASIASDKRGTHLILQAEDLPPIQQQEVFQVWLIKGNQPVNAGTFYPYNGRGALYYTFEPADYDMVSITIEPDALGVQPRGTTILAAGLKG